MRAAAAADADCTDDPAVLDERQTAVGSDDTWERRDVGMTGFHLVEEYFRRTTKDRRCVGLAFSDLVRGVLRTVHLHEIHHLAGRSHNSDRVLPVALFRLGHCSFGDFLGALE